MGQINLSEVDLSGVQEMQRIHDALPALIESTRGAALDPSRSVVRVRELIEGSDGSYILRPR